MLKKGRIFFSSVLLASLFAIPAYADFDVSSWKYYKDIRLDKGLQTHSSIAAVQLDRQVFSGALFDLSDLRVVNDHGEEVPYVVRSEGGSAKIVTYNPKIINLSSIPGAYTTFEIDFGSDSIVHNSIEILTNSINFRRKVEVSGSDDGMHWQILNSGQVIYDYTLEFKAKNTTVSYPESTFRRLKVKIFDEGDTPLSIQGAIAQKTEERAAQTVFYSPQFSVAQENNVTKVLIDLGQRGLETNAITLEIHDENFERYAQIYGSDDAKTWTPVGNDIVYSYKTTKLETKKSQVRYLNTIRRYLLLKINNYDNKPLQITNVQAQGTARSILFLEAGGASYRLYYGAVSARPPIYDLGSVIQRFDESEIASFPLSVQKENPQYKAPITPPPPPVPFSERFPWLLPAVLTITVLILLAIGYLIFKRSMDRDTMEIGN